MKRNEASGQSEITQVSCGDVFLYELVNGRPENLGTAVIYKWNTDRSFEALVVLEQFDKETLHPWGGTMLLNDIVQIIGHWDADRVIRALNEGGEKTGLSVDSERIDRLRIEFIKPPIKV
ncbi:MAG: hypothetical protein ABID64_00930 [Nitrospirota bacterium]